MDSLSNLLLKYHIPGVKAAETRRICTEELSKLVGIEISSKQIKYTYETITLSVPPVLKSAILLRQQELKEKLSAKGITIKTIK